MRPKTQSIQRVIPTPKKYVRVVTDSTACLPHTAESGYGPVVVPLTVVTPHGPMFDGSEIAVEESIHRLHDGEPLSTSQPSPEAFATAFHFGPDISDIVAILLSSELSGTYAGGIAAARRITIPVTVIDSHTTAMGLGFAALEAGKCAAAGESAAHVAERARSVAATAHVRFLVDSLAHLKRGGRISAGTAAIGSALGVRPILEMHDGKIELAQKVRTRNAAVDRLAALAVSDAASMERPAVAVHHFGAADRLSRLVSKIEAGLGQHPLVSELSAVLGSHVGPGALATVVVDLGNHSH
jgi:DegV family protein with EDD domain